MLYHLIREGMNGKPAISKKRRKKSPIYRERLLPGQQSSLPLVDRHGLPLGELCSSHEKRAKAEVLFSCLLLKKLQPQPLLCPSFEKRMKLQNSSESF